MRLKLLAVRRRIEDGTYREGICIIHRILTKEQQHIFNKIRPKEEYPIPSGNPNITNEQAYYAYRDNKLLEGFDHKAYKERRLELLDKVIELCD